MRKHLTKKSLSLSTTTVRSLTDDTITSAAGGYKVSKLCTVIGFCPQPNPTFYGTCTC
jgi:hypothetical protein